MSDWFKDLDTDPMAAEEERNERIRKATHVVNGGESEVLRRCPKCSGRGYRVYGYVNQTTYPCNWCRETGKITDKRIANIERAIKAGETAERNKNERRAQFARENAEIIKFLTSAQQWSTFAASLYNQYVERGALSEKQLDAVRGMMAKQEAKKAEREANRKVIDVSRINELFDTARENGLKRPVFRTDTIKISFARNYENRLYVVDTSSDEYLGKIEGGKWYPTKAAPATTVDVLQAIAADPLKAAVEFGRKTGICCCCGRELTDPSSVEAGIGPICATKWGL